MTEGYKPGQKKTAEEYAALDAEDESLARWKASLGIAPWWRGAQRGHVWPEGLRAVPLPDIADPPCGPHLDQH